MLLRPLAEADLDAVLSWRNHPKVRSNMYTQHEISMTEHRDWYSRISRDATKQYFVFERDKVDLGVVGFTEIDSGNRRASWAFYASPDAPRGTGVRMELLALEHAFSTLALHKLHCEVLSFNQAVVRLHQGFGFQIEGTLREHYFDGSRFLDIVQLGILRDEWMQIRDSLRTKLSIVGAT